MCINCKESQDSHLALKAAITSRCDVTSVLLTIPIQINCQYTGNRHPLRQSSKKALVRSYLRVPQAAGRVEILIFLVKIIFFLYMSIIFVMQGKCLFSDISRPDSLLHKNPVFKANGL